MHRRWFVAVVASALAGCTPHPVGPARTDEAFTGKAVTTAESALSAVETVRLAADAGDDSFGPYLSVLVSDQEGELSGVQGTFASIQPPSDRSDDVRAELDELLANALEHLVDVRVATRRGELDRLADVAGPLEDDAAALRAFIEEHGVKKVLQVTLGILTAIGGFVDMGDLVANASAGARFNMDLAWVVVVGVVGIVVYAEMAGKVAAVSGRPVFDLVRERMGPGMGMANLVASFFINFLILTAEIAGVAIALSLVASVHYALLIPVAAFLVWLVVWRLPFAWMERIFGLGGLALLVFGVTVFQFGPDWGALLHDATHPQIPSQETPFTYAYFAVALFGAAMTPYEVFFFSSGAVEDGWTERDLAVNRANVYIGFPLGGLLSLALMASASLVLAPVDIDVGELSQVVLPAAVVVGKLGLAAAILGVFAATFGAALETALSAGYTISQYFGWTWGKHVRPQEAARFHLVVLLAIAGAALFALSGVDPVKVTEYSIVLSAAALPLTYLPILVIANDPKYIGARVNGRILNAIGSVYLVVLVLVSVATIPLIIITKGGA